MNKFVVVVVVVVVVASSDWLLKLGISCTIHWFAKHNGRVRE